jgi:uncharacterized protein
MSGMNSTPSSPCIRNCCLDDDDVCLGCFRSLEEIKEWGLATNIRRFAILQNANQRREGYQIPSEISPATKIG